MATLSALISPKGRFFLLILHKYPPNITQIGNGLVVGQEKDVSLFLDRTGEPASQQQDSSIRLKNKDTSFIDQQLVLYLAHSGITAAAGKESRNDRIECTIPKIRNWIYLFNNDFY